MGIEIARLLLELNGGGTNSNDIGLNALISSKNQKESVDIKKILSIPILLCQCYTRGVEIVVFDRLQNVR